MLFTNKLAAANQVAKDHRKIKSQSLLKNLKNSLLTKKIGSNRRELPYQKARIVAPKAMREAAAVTDSALFIKPISDHDSVKSKL